MAADPTTTMNALLACALAALTEADSPVCQSGLTIGPPAIGPAGCVCKCSGGTGNGHLSAHLERIYAVDAFSNTLTEVDVTNCRATATAADISVVLVRCYPTIKENGTMPQLSETTPYAENMGEDMATVWKALFCCEGVDLLIRESAVDGDPEGGCAGFAIRVATRVAL